MMHPFIAWTVKLEEFKLPGSTTTVEQGFGNVITLLTTIAGLLVVVFLIWGGLQFVISDGDPKRIQNAKNTLLYAIVGLVLVIAAFAIESFITTNVSK